MLRRGDVEELSTLKLVHLALWAITEVLVALWFEFIKEVCWVIFLLPFRLGRLCRGFLIASFGADLAEGEHIGLPVLAFEDETRV